MVRLTLTANELAIVADNLHYIVADSHYLQMKNDDGRRSCWATGCQHAARAGRLGVQVGEAIDAARVQAIAAQLGGDAA